MEKILIPENIKKNYLSDVTDTSIKRHFRALAVRSCVELLLNHLFFQYINKKKIKKKEILNIRNNKKKENYKEDEISSEEWEDASINNQILLIKNNSSFDPTFCENLHKLRLIGNKGAHTPHHSSITDEELERSFHHLSSICTSLIFEYFKENGMQGTDNTSTIFSCLQPTQRIIVLNQYIRWLEQHQYNIEQSKQFYNKYVFAYSSKDFDETRYKYNYPQPLRLRQSINKHLSSEFWLSTSLKNYDELLLTIDKLALAYLKTGSFFLATSTAQSFIMKNIITESYYNELCSKLNIMKAKLAGYPIAKTQEESIKNLSQVEKRYSKDLDISFLKLIRAMLESNI
ncbi:hypothetical protein [Photobacterium damselae]